MSRLSRVIAGGMALTCILAPTALAADSPPLATSSTSVTITGYPKWTVSSGSTAFVASDASSGRGPGTLSIIDGATATVTRTVRIGPGPMGLAVSPDGRRVVTTSWQEKAARVVDARTGALVAKVPVGGQADAVTIGPKGNSAFVYVIDKGYVAKIDLRSTTVKGRYPLSGCRKEQPVGMAVTPDSTTLLISCDESGLILMNTATGRVVKTLGDVAGGGAPAFSPDGNLAYLGVSAYITVVDVRARRVVGEATLIQKGDGGIDGVDSPMSIAVAPDGSAVYAVMPEVGQISVLDPRTGAHKSRVTVGGKALVGATAALMGPGSRLSVVTRQGLLSIDPATNAVVGTDVITPPGAGTPDSTSTLMGPVLLDGSRIAVPWATFDRDNTQTGAGVTILTMS